MIAFRKFDLLVHVHKKLEAFCGEKNLVTIFSPSGEQVSIKNAVLR